MDGKKLRVGWFSFTCCEDSTIIFTELLNANYKEWLKKIEFVHAKVLKTETSSDLKEMDIAFVEGAITSEGQENKLKKIREKARKLVAIGACAVVGSPSNQRNFFSQQQLADIRPILDRFHYKEKVLKLSDIVKVDESVPGCPMNEKVFLELIDKYLKSYA